MNKSLISIRRPFSGGRACWMAWVLASLVSAASAANVSASSKNAPTTVDGLLWRDVKAADGQVIGVTNDVLVQMPSGQIVFILVKPTALYSEPKALTPEQFTNVPAGKGPLQSSLNFDEWLNSPRLDWDPTLIVKDSSDGAKLFAYYQQAWIGTAQRQPAKGVNVVAQASGTPAPTSYVSLMKLMNSRVETPGWDTAGYIRGFLLDWPQHRATHALLAHGFSPAPRPGESYYAVPMTLMKPPVERQIISVDTNANAITSARPWPEGKLPSAAGNGIYLYPAQSKTGQQVAIAAPRQSMQAKAEKETAPRR
jgi:hypothetical protein